RLAVDRVRGSRFREASGAPGRRRVRPDGTAARAVVTTRSAVGTRARHAARPRRDRAGAAPGAPGRLGTLERARPGTRPVEPVAGANRRATPAWAGHRPDRAPVAQLRR